MLRVQQAASGMTFELVFHQAGGDYALVVDGERSSAEPPSFHGQRLRRGTTFRVRGVRWRVVGQIEQDGAPCFVCERARWYQH